MSCGIACIKYLLFIFNFIFALGGLAILIVGVLSYQQINDYASFLTSNVDVPAIVLIVVGSIIFVIAFFGCCGAIRENHCMVITFAVFMLTVVIVQVAIGVYAILVVKDVEGLNVSSAYTEFFSEYKANNTASVATINTIQTNLKCCGITDYSDFTSSSLAIPTSCCASDATTCTSSNAYTIGCVAALEDFFQSAGTILAGVAIGIAVVEIFGIIFALCLANSIRNADRRGYRV